MAKTKNLIYGRHPVVEALKEGKPFEKILLQKNLAGEEIFFIRKAARSAEIPVQVVPVEKLNRVTGKNHQGVLGFGAVVQYFKLEDVLMQTYDRSETPLFLLLDEITDVRNFGAIARTALCMGVHAIVVPTRGSARIDADAIKASAGALGKLNICRVPKILDAINQLKTNGIRIYGSSLFADTKLHETNLALPCAIVLGSEDLGISKGAMKLCDQEFFIPMNGDFDSLNVSVATGMILYEANKQRGPRSR